VLLAIVYGALTLSVLPWASTPGPRNPDVVLASNVAIAFADLCTALLLAWEFYREPRRYLLLLACAYAFSAAMAIVHLAVFPGALFETPAFGTAQTTSWVFLSWRLGTGFLLFAAVAGARSVSMALGPTGRLLALAVGLAAVGAACAGLASLSANSLQVEVLSGTRFTPINLWLIALYEAVSALTLYLIWRGRGFEDRLFLWLAIVVVASMTDQVLGTLSGAQYTLGWNIAKASAAISAFTLLVLWLGTVRPSGDGGPWRAVATLGAALGVTAAALLMRWFVTPWIGLGYPFATLFGAVAISVWIGGWLPATASATVGFAFAVWLFPESSSEPHHLAATVFGAAMYAVSCAFIIVLGESMGRLERQLRQRAQELHIADRNKSRFLAMVSHELRNPLAPLLNGIMLMRMSQDPAVVSRTRGMMERQVLQLRRLVDDLLDVSRIDQGKLQVRVEPARLDEIVHNALETIAPAIEEKAHALSVSLPSAPVTVLADPARLAQVVANLVHNAAKFTPPGGRIDVGASAADGMAVITVADNGAGFDPADAERIFGMFVQVGDGQGSTQGLGLGLTLVRSLMTLQGGTVEARSEGRGKGATFTCRIPAVEMPQPVERPVVAPPVLHEA
jgi:signal transduction histidine kinase